MSESIENNCHDLPHLPTPLWWEVVENLDEGLLHGLSTSLIEVKTKYCWQNGDGSDAVVATKALIRQLGVDGIVPKSSILLRRR